MGKVKWMRSGNDLPGRMVGDPPHYFIENKEDVLANVEVLLLQGEWNLVDDKLWGMKTLKTILKFGDSDYAVKSDRSKRRKKSSNVPIGWKEGGSRISHQANGGVTDGRFKFEWAVRIDSPEVPFSPPPAVQARLSQVLSQIDSRGMEVVEPEEGEANTFHGVLKWGKRDDLVTAKHVFGKDKWVQRYLSTQEKAESLDFPSTRTAIMTEELINLLTKSEVPGKVLVASLWYLTMKMYPMIQDLNSKQELRCLQSSGGTRIIS